MSRPRLTRTRRTVPPPGRLRRDPRAERQGHVEPISISLSSPAPTPLVIIEQADGRPPAYLVFAVADLSAGRFTAHDRDVLGAARQLADAGGAVVAVVFGALHDAAGLAGADRLLTFDGDVFSGYSPEARVAALLSALRHYSPRHVLFADSPAGGADLGRRLAAALGERAAGNIWKITGAQLSRRAGGGSQDLSQTLPCILLLAPEVAEPVTATRHEARPLALPAVAYEARIVDRGLLPLDPARVALAEADFILSGGNGVRDWPTFHRLAQALGASEGGSRVAVDAGFLPRERQIGATGTYVSARCYLAFGISGAPQHLQGITQCERVITVNLDNQNDMVKRADLAVIGDANAIIAELLRLATERGDAA